MRNLFTATVALMAVALSGVAQAQTVTGNVCGVPIWHHIGGQVYQFKIRPLAPPVLAAQTTVMYSIPLANPTLPGTLPMPGRSVQANDINLRQALGQPGCFDVTDQMLTTDDGAGFIVMDHDVPTELPE